MADKKRSKSSADLIKEARDSFETTPPTEQAKSATPPIVRPSDRITPSYTPPPEDPAEPETPAPPPFRPAETLPEPIPSWESTRPPPEPPSTRVVTPTAPHAEVQDTTASVLNAIGWLVIVLALVVAVLLVIGAFAESEATSGLIIGGAIMVLVPLILGIALIGVARRRRRLVAARSGSSQDLGPVPPQSTSTDTKSAGVPVRDDETVLASVTGVPPGSFAGANVGKIVAAVIVFIIFSSFTGFGAVFLIGGIIFLIARSIKNASSAERAFGRVFPASARLTITDQRVLMTTRSWAPNTPETHTERPISAIEDFKVATGNKPSARITFSDGEELTMATSVASAQLVKQALQVVTA
ncbi:MAG: hypothetical protein ACR2N9_10505 [Acidimicrobiia bacterium]